MRFNRVKYPQNGIRELRDRESPQQESLKLIVKRQELQLRAFTWLWHERGAGSDSDDKPQGLRVDKSSRIRSDRTKRSKIQRLRFRFSN